MRLIWVCTHCDESSIMMFRTVYSLPALTSLNSLTSLIFCHIAVDTSSSSLSSSSSPSSSSSLQDSVGYYPRRHLAQIRVKKDVQEVRLELVARVAIFSRPLPSLFLSSHASDILLFCCPSF